MHSPDESAKYRALLRSRFARWRPAISIDSQSLDNPPQSDSTPVAETAADRAPDYFVRRDGEEFAGTHVLLDLWEAQRLDDKGHVEQALRDAVTAAGATLLHLHLHRFTPEGGISGVAVLAESHISIHTWPERGFAALDIFMCGSCEPMLAVPVLEAAFAPGRSIVKEERRGLAG